MRFFRFIAKILEGFRRLLANLFFLFVLAMFWFSLSRQPSVKVEDGSALIIAPQGALVEQLDASPGELALQRFLREPVLQTRLRDLIEAIEMAAVDDRIDLMVIHVNEMTSAPISKLQALQPAIDRFKAAGKSIISYGDNFSQGQFYLASMADEVYLNPFGSVYIQGFGAYQHYFRDTLDKLAVDVNVYRVGSYKSAVEPYTRNSMSEAAKLANKGWLSDIWASYKQGLAANVGIDGEQIQTFADQYPALLMAQKGDSASTALGQGLVNGLKNRTEMREYLYERIGDKHDALKRIGYRQYLLAEKGLAPRKEGEIGVVVASGTIIDGEGEAGTVGGDSLARLIKDVREDDTLKALVLRIDSPGGSAFASEIIRQELVTTRAAGKPVVVSMGSLAASGGYWIAMPGDEIWATPTTLTGSIGVFGVIPTFQDTLKKMGIHTDGVGTTRMAGELRIDREIGEEVGKAIQVTIEHMYSEFLERVAEAREMGAEEVDKIAQGRVWSGQSALELGLVDKLGNLEDAVASAANLAGLDSAKFHYVEARPSFLQQVLINFSNNLSALGIEVPLPDWFEMLSKLKMVKLPGVDFTDPAHIYAWCACGEAP